MLLKFANVCHGNNWTFTFKFGNTGVNVVLPEIGVVMVLIELWNVFCVFRRQKVLCELARSSQSPRLRTNEAEAEAEAGLVSKHGRRGLEEAAAAATSYPTYSLTHSLSLSHSVSVGQLYVGSGSPAKHGFLSLSLSFFFGSGEERSKCPAAAAAFCFCLCAPFASPNECARADGWMDGAGARDMNCSCECLLSECLSERVSESARERERERGALEKSCQLGCRSSFFVLRSSFGGAALSLSDGLLLSLVGRSRTLDGWCMADTRILHTYRV